MKKLLTYLFILIQYSAFTQTKKNSFDFKKVYDIEMDKEQLKENTNAWMVKTFTNTNSGIKLTSTDNLIARGTFDGVFTDGLGRKNLCFFEYIIEISFKEDRYRLTLGDYTIKPTDKDLLNVAEWGMIQPVDSINEFIRVHSIFFKKYGSLGEYYIKKRLNNPKKVGKQMKKQRKHFDFIQPQILAHQKSISKSLFNYLEKRKESDW